jgi:predicted dithiol-disulfide oxidoreductase (DUF899 family)
MLPSRNTNALPKIVSQAEWEAARSALLVKEKELTKAHDALAAERRRLPMVPIDKPYSFEGPNGKVTLLDLFEGRKQLLLYHFMLGPNNDAGCDGCSMVADHLPHTAHLNARDVSVAFVSRAPLAKLEAYKRRMGWAFPWFSSFGTDFSFDLGVGPKEPNPGEYQDGEEHGWSVFLRDGDKIYRTYFTTQRGGELLGTTFGFLDITPYGRQEIWEDSPKGWPQGKPYEWWRRHDEYDDAAKAKACCGAEKSADAA